MEFDEVIRKQRSRRSFRPDPVDRDVLDRIFRASQKAPSAGFSQGTGFLVLERDDAAYFWATAFPDRPLEPEHRAPVVAIPLCNKQAYLDRYSEPDKQALPVDLSIEGNWPTPFWITDQSFASMIVVLACTNEGLASWYLGISTGWPEIAEHFAVPAGWDELGAIAIGHHAGTESIGPATSRRPRKPFEAHAIYGGWRNQGASGSSNNART
ncbi:MAG: nitroreductase family protein [Microthrixaceae bacterium]